MQSITILLVEDNSQVRRLVKDTLQMEGWHVVACADGFAGLEAIESGEHYDLILTDNDLPGASGIELIRHARSLPHRRHTPIIMLTAGFYQTDARDAGADAFLEKPRDVLAIAQTVTDLLAVTPASI